MVRRTRESEKAARRSARFAAAMVMASLIVLATGMEAQTRGAVTPAGPMSPALIGSAAPTQRSRAQQPRSSWSIVWRGTGGTPSARALPCDGRWSRRTGRPVGPAATTTEYTWERTRTARGWKTTMTMVAAPRVRVQARAGMVTLPEAPTVVKTEDLGDGSAPRFWDLNGVEIKMPSPAVQAQVMGPEATAARRVDG